MAFGKKKDKGLEQNKPTKKRRAKFIEKGEMYDMMLANLMSRDAIIEPEEPLDNSQLAIGFSNISSETQITKYYMIRQFPDYLQQKFVYALRDSCLEYGVKMNFYFYAQPHHINWESAEMRNRMHIWKQYSDEHNKPVDVFAYRNQRGDALVRNRIIMSTKYLNEAELEHKRSYVKVFFIIEISANRDEDSIVAMQRTIQKMKAVFKSSDIKASELRINLLEWLRAIDPFCLDVSKELSSKLSKKVLTDDLLANFNPYTQGRVGVKGIPIGIDINNGGPVLWEFKADPNAAENWLISAVTGGGKSMFIKVLLTYFLASNFVVSVMDYEGDEYDPLANFIRRGNPDDVKIVSMGKGSAVYFDPCEIAELTGDPEQDCDLKKNAVNFIMAIFRTIICGPSGSFNIEQEKIMSMAIKRAYDARGVIDNDQSTWVRSRNMRLVEIYNEIVDIVDSNYFRQQGSDEKHKIAEGMKDATSIYFEEGQVKSGIFRRPMSANELYRAKFIVFSFGMKGADPSSIDYTELALKQLSVAYVNIQISNYCKYTRKCFNVKVWEEFQRWIKVGDSSGNGSDKGSSASIIVNTITGGRKRGDVNFIITNDLAQLLDGSKVSDTLIQNIQHYAIGGIKKDDVRQRFCDTCDQNELSHALKQISVANASSSKTSNRYKHSFCVAFDNGKRVIVKAFIPKELLKSKLFTTGVEVKKVEEEE